MQSGLSSRRNILKWSGLLFFALLVACNSTDQTLQNPTQGNGTPSEDAPPVLVLGDVQSPVFDQLQSSMRFVAYDGSQSINDYDGLVFDGDALTPEAVGTEPLIEQALSSEKWVLGLDVKVAHKKETGLMKYIAFATNYDSPAYLIREVLDVNDQPNVFIYEYPTAASSPTTAQNSGAASGPKITSLDTASFVQTARDAITGRTLTAQQSGGSSVYPKGLYSQTLYYEVGPINWPLTNAKKKNGTQTAYYNVNYQLIVFYDDPGNNETKFQWVVAEIDATTNPNGTNPPPATDPSGSGTASTFIDMSNSEKAWWQDMFTINLGPESDDLDPYGSTPANANQVSSVTSGIEFDVGFQDLDNGGTGLFNYDNSITRNLTDWQVFNDEGEGNNGTLAQWAYTSYSSDGYSVDATEAYGCPSILDCNGFSRITGGMPVTPSDISLGAFQPHMQAIWKSESLLTGTETFTGNVGHRVADTYCLHTYFDEVCQAGKYSNAQTLGSAQTPSISVDMGAVIPTSGSD